MRRDDTKMKTTQAIVLAAGYGSRLVAGGDMPKPLLPVAGRPIVLHILDRLRRIGIREIGIIVGYRADVMREALSGEKGVRFFQNDEYDKPNGTSLLKAASFVTKPTLLVMSDHLWTVGLGERLIAFDAPEEDAVLAVDTNIAGCFDLPDATKVQTRDSKIVRIGKELGEFDCLDTGVFRISPALIDALEQAETENGCSLSEGVMKLASQKRMWACDVTGESWIDVDTPEAHAFCEENLESFER